MGERCGFRAGGADRRRASAARLLSRPARSGTQEPEGVGAVGALFVSFAYYKTGHARRGVELSAASPDIV